MTYQGVVKGNVVVVKGRVRLQEGQIVEIHVPKENRLLKFSGVISSKDAEIMRKEIHKARRSSIKEAIF